MLRKIRLNLLFLLYMMVLTSASVLLLGNRSFAQTFDYGNDWVDVSKPWVKIRVWEDGVYRVTAQELAAAGLDTNSANPGNLHLFYRGEEQAIYVESNAGRVAFMDFYGLRNDGRVDSTMYREPYSGVHGNDLQPNKRLSLFSDTSSYFLTWDNNPGIRVSSFFDNSYASYTPETAVRVESYYEYHPDQHPEYNRGGGAQYDIFHNLNSNYITGQGYCGRPFGYGYQRVVYIPTPLAANNGIPHQVHCRVHGLSSWQHILEVKVQNNSVYWDTTSGVYIKSRKFNYSNNLTNNTQLRFLGHGTQQNNTDNNYLVWASIFYDRLPDLNGGNEIHIEDYFETANTYVRLEDADITSEGWVWDLNNQTRIRAQADLDTLKAIIPGASAPRRLAVVTDNGLKTALCEQVTFQNLSGTANNATFIIITHSSLATSAAAYKNYRDTCTVNPQTARVVYVQDIYNEFGYGTVTPLAIKRFCKWAIDNWGTQPEYFFLWGKGHYETRNSPFCLVPAFGYPASDYDFVSDFNINAVNTVPEAAIGRVNVNTDNEGYIYLDKINEYEHMPWAPWMKEAVFLGGGEDTLEQLPILQYLQRYRAEFESAPNGGQGFYWQKYNTGLRTNAPNGLDPADEIDHGVSIINFFGHSTRNIYDVDIQEPYLYENYGRYPVILAFGCYGGEFTKESKSFGERFVLERNRGSIGYLANSTAGYLNPLGQFGDVFYPIAYGTHFGQPIGKIMIEAQREYASRWVDQLHINHAKQLNYQGDPAMALFNATRPDLSIVEDDVWFEPSNFSASDSSFTLKFIVRSLAITPQDSFRISVRQLTPQGQWIDNGTILHPPILLNDTVSFLIQNTLGSALAGMNIFDIYVDSTDAILELTESNNRLSYQQVIPGNVPGILHPYDFAVIDSNKVKLAASALVMSNQQNVNYLYEIDTDPNFNSPNLRRSQSVNGTAVYSEWEVPFTLRDSTVYYWRVRLRDILPAVWASASFKYIQGKRGWGQSEPPQFFTDGTNHITMDQIQREWEFDPRKSNLHAWVEPAGNAYYRLGDGVFRSNDVNGVLWGVMFVSIDPKTLIPGALGTVQGDWRFLAMPQAEGDLANAINSAPDGNWFLLVSQQNAQPQLWSNSTITALHRIGVDTARFGDLQDYDPFVILGRKGYPGQANEIYLPNVVDSVSGVSVLDLRQTLTSSFYNANITSTLIGPSVDWNELIWDWSTLDAFPYEKAEVEVRAVRSDNSDSLIYSGLAKGNYTLNGVDHTNFPYMRLYANVADSIQLTAPQLDNWYVLNEPAPDAAIDPITNFSFDRDTVLEGQTISLNLSARNVSYTDMDSLLVAFSIIRPNLPTIQLPPQRYAELPARGQIDIPYSFGTGGYDLDGDMTLRIELNPNNDQPEMFFWNNIYNYPFHVLPDKINPILDVTFDGKHLMDGDIVSPDPDILIEINDENPYLAVSDTAFEVYFGIRTLTGSGMSRVFIDGNPQMEKQPAQLPENKARLTYRPGRLTDGEYTLRVQGYDQNGNAAGDLEYEINFEVVNQNAITEVLNYPNPFSTKTQFVYTLTGDQLPERFEIHIFTITGKLVKVIDLVELGEVNFGRNVTDFAWDGTDEFGDMLANGVYVYKVITSLNGAQMENRDEGLSEFFNKNGYGKMYIMR